MKAILLVGLALMLTGCAPVWSEDVDALLEPGSTHNAYRIRNPSLEYIADKAEVLAGPIEMSTDWARRFDEVVLAIGKDRLDEFNTCIPNPGVKVSIERNGNRADVLLCFECSIILVEDASGKGSADGFVDYRTILGNLAIEAFPDDEKLADVINRK